MLKCAKNSPRVCEDGSIRWYAGDTFNLEFDITFTDDDDNILEIKPTDKITICFRDAYGKLVFESETVGTNILNVNIDAETTQKFKQGIYTCCIRLCSNFVTTVIRKNKVVVE